ncbi:TetR/AcrR family transcriptional regulator [Luteimonas sp. RD2P54]|uniref:TetR/AcrR family transcriptional regulator n=1 Tax=Luteimonas endophytica TaxID=3042023 RepID=A0ABT6JEU5_9GAMM|nr:TetR/AcrR family transcriptional regulator [Luteimonas endophytica]MDH5824723.1 TetR/AcrR family transcriptional regulator [Luteimonas endophytica]
MSRKSTPRIAASPGRPKDLTKRAAILDAAERMFLQHGYEGVSMDQIAAEAGVSKLTVYSHFGDKDALFAEAARAYCEQQMPASVFAPAPATPLRERLLEIARAFFAMVFSAEAVAGHRLLCTPQMVERGLARAFWEGGPMRVQSAFAGLLRQRVAAGELEIADIPRASAQFFTLLKGDLHARLVFQCCDDEQLCEAHREAHIQASVDMFLRAYAPARQARRA